MNWWMNGKIAIHWLWCVCSQNNIVTHETDNAISFEGFSNAISALSFLFSRNEVHRITNVRPSNPKEMLENRTKHTEFGTTVSRVLLHREIFGHPKSTSGELPQERKLAIVPILRKYWWKEGFRTIIHRPKKNWRTHLLQNDGKKAFIQNLKIAE